MKMHIKGDEVKLEEVAPGVKRRILGYESNIMMVKVYFEKGSVGYVHQHPHQQISYVVSGKFEVEIDGVKKVLESGDAFVIPPDLLHGAVCLEDGVLIDTFSPMREDFIGS